MGPGCKFGFLTMLWSKHIILFAWVKKNQPSSNTSVEYSLQFILDCLEVTTHIKHLKQKAPAYLKWQTQVATLNGAEVLHTDLSHHFFSFNSAAKICYHFMCHFASLRKVNGEPKYKCLSKYVDLFTSQDNREKSCKDLLTRS